MGRSRRKAKELIAELDNGADFAELAKENSDDTGSAEMAVLWKGLCK